MRIQEYLDSIKKYTQVSADGEKMSDVLLRVHSVWDNDACKGYCIQAMKWCGYNEDQIEQVLRALGDAFNEYTVEAAAKIQNDGK